MRAVAVDWSGARAGERRTVWLAEAVEGRLVRLECGRSREELVAHLLGEAARAAPGSSRGTPSRPQLRKPFAIWPFDEPRRPLLVEIYPSLYLNGRDGYPNEHARDAAASALALSRWAGDWRRLPRPPEYAL